MTNFSELIKISIHKFKLFNQLQTEIYRGKESTHGHIMVKLQKIKDKERILRAAKERVLLRRYCRLTTDFSKIVMKARRQNDSFLTRYNYQAYTANSVKIPFKNNEKIKDYQDGKNVTTINS